MIETTGKPHKRRNITTHRTCVYGFLFALFVFVCINYVVWKKYTEVLLTDKFAGGDLARMAYLIGSKDFRSISNDLPVRHIGMEEFRGQHVDVLTIGDSFSFGCGGGKNPYYQDYIASINNLTVMNAIPYPTEDLVAFFAPLSTLKILYNSGYLDIIKPRIVLIESVERYCIQRYSKPIDQGKKESLEKVRAHYRNKSDIDFKLPEVNFINDGNVKFLLYNLFDRFSLNPLKGTVLTAQLDAPFFSVRDNNKLLVFRDDVDNIKSCNIASMKLLNDNFNSMARLLKQKGIKLYFMPIVDKYDLYSGHIVNNPYPRSNFFEILRTLPKEYELIDTKAILLKLLEKGEKDLYYADDTHWSWKAPKTIFEQVKLQ